MVDTATIKITDFNYDSISAIIDACGDAVIKYRKDGTSLKTGSHKNVRLYLTPNLLSINFCPPKLINGSNAGDITMDCFIKAIEYIEQWLGVSLNNAKISRLDISGVVMVDYDVYLYLDLLMAYPRAKKKVYDKQTVTFKMGSQNITAYDKTLEVFEKDGKVLSGNRLKFEVQLKNAVSRQLKIHNLTVGMLSRRDVASKLVEYWAGAYFKIYKKLRPQAIINCSDVKSFTKSLASFGIDALGADSILNHITSMSDQLDAMQKSRLIKRTRELVAFQPIQSSQALLDELAEKINWIAANAS